jgi:hypothetical protein
VIFVVISTPSIQEIAGWTAGLACPEALLASRQADESEAERNLQISLVTLAARRRLGMTDKESMSALSAVDA